MKDYEVPQTVEQEDPSIPHLALNGAVFHSETFGDPQDPVVIVVHGGPGWDYGSLQPFKALGDKFFVVFYDQRGTGLSPRVDAEQLSLDSSLTDLDALVDHYGRGRKVSLIGHSWGGMLVSSYLGRHPDKVRFVVLAEPGPLTAKMAEIFRDKLEFGAPFVFHVMGAWIASLAVSGPDQQASADYFHFPMLGAYEGDDHPLAGYYCNRKAPPAAFEHWRLGRMAWVQIPRSNTRKDGKMRVSLVEGVEAFRDEVLFLTSACDVILDVEFQQEQMQYFPNARMVVIDDVGHSLFGKNPTETLAPVRAYLSSPVSP